MVRLLDLKTGLEVQGAPSSCQTRRQVDCGDPDSGSYMSLAFCRRVLRPV